MIQLSQVTKTFDDTAAVHSLDIIFRDGITSVLIGPSASGKSTVLRLIMGLIQPEGGTVYFDGSPVSPEVVLSLRRRIGYVIQEGGLFPHLTARNNVTIMARYLRRDRRMIDLRVQQLTDVARLPAEALDRFPAQLSGGQRQRVSLMRALMLDPDVLLLDEPLGALDPLIRAELQTDLKNIFQTLKKTVVIVTHDMGEAAFFGDHIVLFSEGRIVQQGTLRELLHAPADPFVTLFINAQRSPLASL